MNCYETYELMLAAVFVLLIMIIAMLALDSKSKKKIERINYEGFVRYVEKMRAENVPISAEIEKTIEDNKYLLDL